jgi:hypothetical protein
MSSGGRKGVPIPFPEPDAGAHTNAETARKLALFKWADALLQRLGFATRAARAQSDNELDQIALDLGDVEVEIAIRDALNPAAGKKRAEHFVGMNPGMLKRLLQSRLNEAKKERKAELKKYGGATGPTAGPDVNVLELALTLTEEHVGMSASEHLATALWILHTSIFNHFDHTPRLALLSPVRGCGKTTVLTLADLLCARPFRSDDTTAAAIYRYLYDHPMSTLLIDEVDNHELWRNRSLRTLFNSGHFRDGATTRFIDGRTRRFSTFAPLAVAAIGMLPLPLMSRSVVINMRRNRNTALKRLNRHDPAFAAAREQIRRWVATCSLNLSPDMPIELRNRETDNWRILLSIADDLGYGKQARVAAIELTVNRPDEDPGVTLLRDIRTIFEALGVDRITSLALALALVELPDAPWCEWRGPNDDKSARRLSQGELARLLKPFVIKPRTIWPLNRTPGDKSSRGYLRSSFEEAWSSYLDEEADTATQPSNIRYLGSSRADT